MSKIICDICGTTYPDTADCCPICGCSHDSAMDFLGDSVDLGESVEDLHLGKGRFSGQKRQIFDFDEVNAQENDTVVLDEEDDEEYEQPDSRPRGSIAAVIILTVIIAVLLLASAFLLFRYILPNMGPETEPVATTALATEAPATTELTIPCQSLALNSGGEAMLTQEGMYHLIHVGVIPENTTDVLTFASADEAIATVTEDGRITAVSEGETEIYISCGNFQQTVKVTCKFEEDTVPTEEAVAETGAEAQSETVEAGETVAATEETAAPIRTDVKLKLKKTDITLSVYYEYQLMLDCDLQQNEVEWSVEHGHIASVDKEGNIKALKTGTTEVIAKYGDQEARCIVRCG